ncbi:MAG: DUF1464 family protein [Candidatus Nezhaarchaeales archaeon]
MDPGTKSMDIFGFDDESGDVVIDEAIPRDEITVNPSIIIERLRRLKEKIGRIDAIVGPSGYGMPLKRACDATDEDIALATFVTKADAERRLKIIGLRDLMRLMREADDLNIWFTPGVIHLPTVPLHRKANRIDMGTADKVFSVAFAIKDQAERLGIKFFETSFILVEIGFAYTSAIAVERGSIVDAMAGTAGFPSYLGMGFMDSELVYALVNALSDMSKLELFTGGAAFVAGIDPYKVEIDEFVKQAKADSKVKSGYELMIESIVKDVAVLLTTSTPREIILSGRFTRIPEFMSDVKRALESFLDKINLSIDITTMNRRASIAKEGAEGAAIIANGLANGKYKEIIDVLKLRESNGDIFRYLYLSANIRERLNIFRRLSP